MMHRVGALTTQHALKCCGSRAPAACPDYASHASHLQCCGHQVEPLGLPRGYQEVRPGDCIVAFSRRDIYDIKHTIEALTGKR